MDQCQISVLQIPEAKAILFKSLSVNKNNRKGAYVLISYDSRWIPINDFMCYQYDGTLVSILHW